MTEPIDVIVQSAVLMHLSSPALSGSPSIAYPLVAFTPTPGTAYLDARPILRAEPDQPFLAFDSDVIHRGVFQVDTVAPDGAGEAPAVRLASLVAERFAVGTMIYVSWYRIKVLQVPTIGATIKDAPWIRVPVSVPYYLSS